MTAPLNQLLFYLSILFYSPVTFISQETEISFDFSQNNLELIFHHLETPELEKEKARAALLQIDTASQIDSYLTEYTPGFGELKLQSKQFHKNKRQLDAKLTFSFTDKESSLKALGIYHVDGKYHYALLKKESVLSTNGKVLHENGQKFIVWDEAHELIELKLKHKALDDPNLQKMVNAKKYWQ
ncbi:hypothetical protein QYS49_35050 [Marivirga salinae]|uniref:Uncharacterized protein n=1 Tax=Marivirga salinarum TaxID=3059078 RepID=A0AA51NCU5_9BACT|nr:hypothetical protein [Marivirga sp. BDSF4-3]WMN12934.1 hypothetical protein QYS49_35050 [Marivirga sp. BDSF4-3]